MHPTAGVNTFYRHTHDTHTLWLSPAWFQTGSSDCKVIMSASAHTQIKIIAWFQTYPAFWMLYAFFWVMPPCLTFIYTYIIQTPGNYPEESTQDYSLRSTNFTAIHKLLWINLKTHTPTHMCVHTLSLEFFLLWKNVILSVHEYYVFFSPELNQLHVWDLCWKHFFQGLFHVREGHLRAKTY